MSTHEIKVRATNRWVAAGVMARLGHELGVVGHVGRYELRAPIGKGAHGRVWRGYDPQLHREVAIKMPRMREGEDQLTEARASAQVSHPNLVEVYDVGVEDGEVWIAMELIEGQTLRKWLRGEHSRGSRMRVVRELADAVVALHAAGLVHGDIKPENVVVTPEGKPVLTDLGYAKPIGAGDRGPLGTFGYLAPELRDGGDSSPATDQYAFATTAIEVLRPVPYARVDRLLERGRSLDPELRWPNVAALAWRLREPKPAVLAAVASSVLAACLGVALVVSPASVPTPRPALPRPELRSLEASVELLHALQLEQSTQHQEAFRAWSESVEDAPDRLAATLSMKLGEAFLEGQRPLEAAWTSMRAVTFYQAASEWSSAASARRLAARAYETSGGQLQAEHQLRCASINDGGQRCD